MYKLILVHERNEVDQVLMSVRNDTTVTPEDSNLSRIRTFLAEAYQAEESKHKAAESASSLQIRQPYICCILQSQMDQQEQLDLGNTNAACDEIRPTPIYPKDVQELLIKAKLSK